MCVVDGLFRAAILAATCVLVVACSGGDRLQLLLDDPVAQYASEGIELTRESIQGDQDVLGKPVEAQVLRVYRIKSQELSEEALLDAAAFAEANGWEMYKTVFPTAYQGTKVMGSETARVTLAAGSAEPGNTDSARALRLVLDFGHLPEHVTQGS